MNIPAPCAKCSPFGGSWMETETGVKRCDCPRGRALAAKAKVPDYRDPVISTEQATLCTEMMAGIPFFPPEEGARAVISNEIAAMCESDEQARWLAMRMVRLYRKWPGAIEMRIVFCSTHQPLDAIAAIGESEAYPDGIPSERPPERTQARLSGTREDHLISGSPSVEVTVHDLAVKTDMNRAPGPVRVRDIPVRRLTDADRITPEMIEAAVLKNREERARRELGLEPGKETEDAKRPGSAEGV